MLSTFELARARELASGLLDDLDLRNYVFEIEPAEEQWQLRLSCAMRGDWVDIRLPISRERLLRSDRDMVARQDLLREWGERLR